MSEFTAGSVNRVEWEHADAGGKGVNVASFLADAGFNLSVTGLLGLANREPFVELFKRKRIEDQCHVPRARAAGVSAQGLAADKGLLVRKPG